MNSRIIKSSVASAVSWVEESPEDLEARDQIQTGARGYVARTLGPWGNWETEK